MCDHEYGTMPARISFHMAMTSFRTCSPATGVVLASFIVDSARNAPETLVSIAVLLGVWMRWYDSRAPLRTIPWDMRMLTLTAGLCVVLGASVVFWIWSGLARLFLPSRVAAVLIEWQQSPSDRISDLARQ